MKNLLLCCMLLISLSAVAQPLQEYYFNSNLTGTNGAGSLTELISCTATPGAFGTDSIITTNGLCSVSTAFCFNAGGGFSYPNSSLTGTYTINLFFKFNTLGGWSRIIDFSNSVNDAGFYLLNNCLNFYPNGNVGTCPYFQPNIYYLFTFVRDGSTNIISVYVNGALFGSYTDTGNIYMPATTTTPVNFFRDDNTVACEDKAGCIKYASVSSQMLSAAEVDSIWINICSISLPPCTAFISYPGSPYLTSLTTAQNVTQSGTTGGTYSSTTGLTIDPNTGAITPSTSNPGAYVVTYTVPGSGSCSTYSTTANVTIAAPVSTTCSPNGNMLIFTNYDGGILNINVDVNIPNLKIGVVSYENASINITGPYAGNVTNVVYAGYEGTDNNCNFANPIATTNINGVPPGNYSINQFPPVTLSNPNGNQFYIICAYSCDNTSNQGGCNTIDQVLAYFNTQLGGTLYSLNSQYCCWQNSSIYSVSALSNSCCNTTTGTAAINYTGTPFCHSIAAPQAVTITGNTTGTFNASPTGLAINSSTGQITPSISNTGSYTVTYTLPGCPDFTTTATVNITAAPTASISYASGSFCTGASLQTVTLTGTTGGIYSVNNPGLSIDTVTGSINPATSASGTYLVTYTSSGGACGQVSANTTVTISPVISNAVSASICNGSHYTFGSQTIDTVGTFSQTFPTSSGCDSVVTLSLSFYPPPVATITASDTIFCAGDSSHICASQGFSSYAWNSGETGTCIFAKNAGNYYVTVTDANTCTVQSGRVSMQVYPTPSVSISVNNDTLKAFGGTNYQWYLSDTAINGAHGATYIAHVSGSYKVAVTDTNGCATTSSAIQVNVITTGIMESRADDFIIYPNPVKDGNLYIETGIDWIGNEFEIITATGQLVYRSAIKSQKFDINLSVAQGVYFLRVNSKSGFIIKQIIRL